MTQVEMSGTSSGPAGVFVDQVSGEVIDGRLDPQAFAVAAGAVRSGGLPSQMAAKRAAFDALFAGEAGLSGRAEPVESVTDHQVETSAGTVPVRVYRPQPGRLPALVYAHGGGFEKGSLTSHDPMLRRLANDAGVAVVAVEYALAPEATYPTQADQVFGVLQWVAEHAQDPRIQLDVDASRLAVGGDSVGGNLAAVTAQRARDQAGPALAFQLLLYPVTDLGLDTASWQSFADGPWLSREYEHHALHTQYLAGQESPGHPYVSPLRAGDLSGLPSAFVADAQFDGYRDEGQAYAGRLAEAGVAVDSRVYPGMIHDFALMAGRLDGARAVLRDAAAALRAALRTD